MAEKQFKFTETERARLANEMHRLITDHDVCAGDVINFIEGLLTNRVTKDLCTALVLAKEPVRR